MAYICLHLQQADGRLPMVCIRCGATATTVKTKVMTWQPFAGGMKQARLQAPLCARHQGHWTENSLIHWLVGVLAVGLACGGVIACLIMNGTTPRPQWVNVIGPLLAVASVVLYVGCLILAIILKGTAIRPREITGNHILLSGVCEAFADAVENAEIEYRVRLRQWHNEDAAEEASLKSDNNQASLGTCPDSHAIAEDRTSPPAAPRDAFEK